MDSTARGLESFRAASYSPGARNEPVCSAGHKTEPVTGIQRGPGTQARGRQGEAWVSCGPGDAGRSEAAAGLGRPRGRGRRRRPWGPGGCSPRPVPGVQADAGFSPDAGAQLPPTPPLPPPRLPGENPTEHQKVGPASASRRPRAQRALVSTPAPHAPARPPPAPNRRTRPYVTWERPCDWLRPPKPHPYRTVFGRGRVRGWSVFRCRGGPRQPVFPPRRVLLRRHRHPGELASSHVVVVLALHPRENYAFSSLRHFIDPDQNNTVVQPVLPRAISWDKASPLQDHVC